MTTSETIEAPPVTPVVEIKDLSKAYGPNQALTDVSMSLTRGSIHALLGGNGSGKSTLIKCLAGVVKADAGAIRVGADEWSASAQTPELATANHFRFVHQQNTTFADLSVAENLGFGGNFKRGRSGRIDWRAQRRHTNEVLERFHVPAVATDSMSNLGAAVQMLVAIARAMQDIDSDNAGLLVLDEPTASLPRDEVDFLLSSLRRLARSGQSILVVTHRLAEVEQVCDRATVLRDGRVAERLDRDELDQATLVKAITGNDAPAQRTRKVRLATSAVLEYAPSDGSRPLVVRAGECVGLAGLLSSGRSNLLKRTFGALRRGEDQVRVNGREVACRPGAAMRAGLAFVPEDRPGEALFPEMTLTNNLSVAHPGPHRRGPAISAASERAEAQQLIATFGVKTASCETPISALSGGNQQKVVLARWMQRQPKFLLLDEPTQGIDIGARNEIHDVIESATKDGLGVVLVSSDFEELAEVCDRVLLVQAGRIVGEVPAHQISEEGIYQNVFAKESVDERHSDDD